MSDAGDEEVWTEDDEVGTERSALRSTSSSADER